MACARLMTSRLFTLLLLLLVVGWEFGVLLVRASKKPFWYDELLTFHVSALKPFSVLLKALQAGSDGMPPLYYVIVRLARMFPGDPHVTLRLPSIIGYILSLLGGYLFARRRLPVIAALTTVLLISLSPFRLFALEARSYALLVGCLTVSAVVWQRIGEKRFMTPLLAVFLVLAVSSHHLAVVSLSGFCIAELTSSFLSQRIRWGVWAAYTSATVPFFLSLPLLLNYRNHFAKTFWARPQWSAIVTTYEDYLGLDARFALLLIVLFGIVIGTALVRTFEKGLRVTAPAHDLVLPETILVSGFLYYPALLVILTKLLDSGYTARYGWPAIFGLVMASIYLLRSSWAASPQFLSALLVVFAAQGFQDFKIMAAPGSTRTEERWARLEILSRYQPGIPVVIASPLDYLEAFQYSPSQLHDRLVEVVDANRAARLGGSDTADKTNRILAQFIPLQVEDLQAFERANKRFILYPGGILGGLSRRDWITQYFLDSGYTLRMLAIDRDNSADVYVAER